MNLDVNNALWSLPGLDVYASLPPDRLHDADLGVFRWFVLNAIEHIRARSPRAVAELDRRLRVLTTPPISGVKSFGRAGFTGLQR